MPSKVDELVLQVEALLFASGRPLSVRELADALHLADHRPVQSALRHLATTYEGRQTALEVRHVGDKYALQVREGFVPVARAVTPIDMAPRTLKALTLIAYHQPMLQSVLARMLGDIAYDEVGRLRSLGLVRAEPHGATLELTTTRLFAEQFGIPTTDPEEIRKFLEQKLGVSPTTGPTEGATLEPPAAVDGEPGETAGPDGEPVAESSDGTGESG
ncbi:MAG TPA: SMC-Scp complex subunit ScpB [Thermoplasmata archaeon]|nr:SMC-Scp complex subunit ScpB [Thermoplasmata archaeon]